MKKQLSSKLFLLDGNAFAYRAFYAIRALSDSKGRATNAVYGFLSILNKLMADHAPEYIAAAFDVKGPTFRHKRFEEYKIQRKPMPDSLVEQLPVIKEFLRAYRIPVLEQAGYEADDILATVARTAARAGLEVFIVTGDKDALQLVDEKIKVLNVQKEGRVYDRAAVYERYGVMPERMVELMALMGDATDNIPGVKGIGEKTAIELMKEFGSLDQLFSRIGEVKSASKRELLAGHRDDALLSRELATLDDAVPVAFELEKMRVQQPDVAHLRDLFREYEFKRLLQSVLPASSITTTYTIVDSRDAFDRFLGELSGAGEFAFDFETTGTDPLLVRPVGVSFSWKEGEASYVPLIPYASLPDQYTGDEILARLKPVFEDARIGKVGQNVKYEMLLLRSAGIMLAGVSFDTMVASYLLNPSKFTHNLEDICLEYLQHTMTPITELIGKGKHQKTMDLVPLDTIARYCANDSDVTWRLKGILGRELAAQGLERLFTEVEMPLVAILADMEYAGIKIDVGILAEMSVSLASMMKEREREVWDLAHEEFNLNSPRQLSVILFDKLGLPKLKKTKTGYSTDEEVLTQLSGRHPLPRALLRYREYAKLKSTYIDALPQMINPRTGRLHTSFNQTVTATGRLSSSDPNLQNIPIRTEIGRQIRRAFVAEDQRYLLVSADYSQIELRILAHLSEDPGLLSAFADDQDIHTHTAALIHEVPEQDVTEQMRAVAKTVNFGIVYGMSAFGLSKDLDIDIALAQTFITNYFARYPRVREYTAAQVENARRQGYVETLLGRRRAIPEVNSSDVRLRQFGERMAVNTPVQGSAADLIKMAMIAVSRRIQQERIDARMLLQVHDELVFEVGSADLERAVTVIREGMEHVMTLRVPLKTKLEIGRNWLEMEACAEG